MNEINLLEDFNVIAIDINAESSIPEEAIAAISEALTDFRTKTYKAKRGIRSI